MLAREEAMTLIACIKELRVKRVLRALEECPINQEAPEDRSEAALEDHQSLTDLVDQADLEDQGDPVNLEEVVPQRKWSRRESSK